MNNLLNKALQVLIFCALSCAFATNLRAADYSHGDLCSVTGAYHINNNSTNVDYLICDGVAWAAVKQLDSSGNMLVIDDDPASGQRGCLSFNNVEQRLEYSNDCVTYEPFGGLWSVNPSSPLEIYYNNGNIGIGTNNPEYDLDVVGDILVSGSVFFGRSNNRLSMSANSVTFNNSNRNQLLLDQSANRIVFGGAADRPSRITFGTGNLLYVYSLSTEQKVGINKELPDVELDVAGDIRVTGRIRDVSDIRAKTDIIDISGALDNILTLKPVSFTNKGENGRRLEYGFIAQDVLKVLPDLVFKKGDHLGINYVGFLALLSAGTIELNNQIDVTVKSQQGLQERLIDIEARISALERDE